MEAAYLMRPALRPYDSGFVESFLCGCWEAYLSSYSTTFAKSGWSCLFFLAAPNPVCALSLNHVVISYVAQIGQRPSLEAKSGPRA